MLQCLFAMSRNDVTPMPFILRTMPLLDLPRLLKQNCLQLRHFPVRTTVPVQLFIRLPLNIYSGVKPEPDLEVYGGRRAQSQ